MQGPYDILKQVVNLVMFIFYILEKTVIYFFYSLLI